MPKIFQSKELSADRVRFQDRRTNKYGGVSIPVRYLDENENEVTFFMQVPKMTTPFGAGRPPNMEDAKFSVEVTLADNNPAQERFHEFLKKFDEYAIEQAIANCKEWFGRPKLSREIAEEFYVPMVKIPKDKNGEPTTEYPPRFKVQLPYYDGDGYGFKLFNSEQERIVMEKDMDPTEITNLITGRSQVVALLRCKGMWYNSNRFGISWALVQMQVFPPEGITGFAIMDNEFDEEDDVNDGEEME
jgi:hypothetical protein